MEKYFIDKWDKNKDKLQEYFRTHIQEEYCESYENILSKLIEIVFNDEDRNLFNTKVQSIDYGDYQGTIILTFSTSTYQPSENETFYTIINYGSCSGCDTLQGICLYNYDEFPTREQVNDYMSLALHLVQHIKCFGNFEEEYL